jgi:chromosome segregation ATPase
MGAQIRDLGEEDVRLAGEIGSLGERRQSLAQERDGKLHDLGEAALRHADRASRVDEIEAALSACRATLLDRRGRHESLRSEQMRVAGARAELSRAGAELRERGLQLERRRERLVDELAQTRAESASLAEARARLDVTRRQTGVQLSLLTAELGDVEASGRPASTCGPRRRSRSPSFA